LRGCIGFPLPVLPLRTALVQAALSAATEDPRFPPVGAPELDALTIEVSVLSVPVPLRSAAPERRVEEVRVGRDGLIVDGYGTSGLLLPQVGPEQGWSAEELLDGTCEKAGLPPGAWRDPKVRVRRFEAEVFAEQSPAGKVLREGE
ncbi:MAG: TIGR00296 family protein, partial [Thermoplasmata archaeon]